MYLETVSSGAFDFKTTLRLATHLNLALWHSRETRATMAVIAAVFLFAMPFGSHELPLLQRLTYFSISLVSMFVGTYLALIPIHFLLVKGWLRGRLIFVIVTILIVAYATACLSYVRYFLGTPLEITDWEIALRISPMIFSTVGTIVLLSPFTAQHLMRRRIQNNLTHLIAHEKRGQLIKLSVEENYVAVTTSGGTTLLRMSLAAAMKLIEPGIGVQIHRSHWVAISAIKKIDEQARFLELENGETLPISAQRLPELTLELSRRDIYSQQSNLFARNIAKVGVLTSLQSQNTTAREVLDKMFLAVFQGKAINDRERIRIAYQIYRLSTTEFTYLGVQLVLFTGLSFTGTYGLFDLPWYQPPLFWVFGYFLCFFVTTVAHVFVWFIDLKYGSKGWLGAVLLTFTEATSSVTVLYFLSLALFGPVMVPYLTFLISSYFLHALYAPIVHIIVQGHQSFSSWQKAIKVPPIVLQLPYETRGEVISIAANKRAVDVTTTSGTSTIKKKFGDALSMLGERKGIQVHRSHWVASPYIKGRCVLQGLNYVELTTGEFVPLAAANVDLVDDHLRRFG